MAGADKLCDNSGHRTKADKEELRAADHQHYLNQCRNLLHVRALDVPGVVRGWTNVDSCNKWALSDVEVGVEEKGLRVELVGDNEVRPTPV